MTEPLPDTGVRASDAERREIAEALQQHYTTGRLTLAELDERVAAAYAARTRDQLALLVTDLPTDPPGAPVPDPVQGVGAGDPGLLIALCFVCPPAGLVYWLYTRRARRRLRDEPPR